MRATREDILKTGRLSSQAAFDCLRQSKVRWVSKGFAIQVCPSKHPCETVSFCVISSKKTAKKAVDRNRMRRRLRAVALEILPQRARYDIDYMIVARRELPQIDMEQLRRDLVWCLKRLDVLK